MLRISGTAYQPLFVNQTQSLFSVVSWRQSCLRRLLVQCSAQKSLNDARSLRKMKMKTLLKRYPPQKTTIFQYRLPTGLILLFWQPNAIAAVFETYDNRRKSMALQLSTSFVKGLTVRATSTREALIGMQLNVHRCRCFVWSRSYGMPHPFSSTLQGTWNSDQPDQLMCRLSCGMSSSVGQLVVISTGSSDVFAKNRREHRKLLPECVAHYV
jgi:hypothetical protein